MEGNRAHETGAFLNDRMGVELSPFQAELSRFFAELWLAACCALCKAQLSRFFAEPWALLLVPFARRSYREFSRSSGRSRVAILVWLGGRHHGL